MRRELTIEQFDKWLGQRGLSLTPLQREAAKALLDGGQPLLTTGRGGGKTFLLEHIEEFAKAAA
jgi:Lhr-like helicase